MRHLVCKIRYATETVVAPLFITSDCLDGMTGPWVCLELVAKRVRGYYEARHKAKTLPGGPCLELTVETVEKAKKVTEDE